MLHGITVGHGRQEHAARPALLWAAGARRPEVEEALWPLDDIVRSLELESFILTKLTKPSVLVNLVGPQVSHPLWWVPASRGYSLLVHNKDACRLLTTLTRPRREHQGGGRRRGLGRERHGAGEYSAVVSHAEEYEGLLFRLPSPENNSMCG